VIRLWLALFIVGFPAAAWCAVERVVSLNLCTDQMLVLLAPEKAAALTPLARDPALSFVAHQAAGLPVVRPSAEAVLRLHPDLVLAGPFGAQATVAALDGLGLRVLRVAQPDDFAGIREEIRRLAVALGVPARGDALIATMDARLASVPRPVRRRTAIAWEPRGDTAGPGTLMDAVLRAAGLVNIGNGRSLGREALLRHPPDLLVMPEAAPAFPSLATGIFHDPALAKLPRRTLPPRLTICAGPFTARAVLMLAR
jgi:iron complex transport system substrate-binding protein